MAKEQINNPLHGMTIEKIMLSLQEFYGWDGIAERIDVRCFTHEPSIKSSPKFLRRTPWIRKKVEDLFVYSLDHYVEEEVSTSNNHCSL